MIKVLFVCHGNICRSTMAEFLMKDLVRKAGLDNKFHIASAGTSREEIGADTHPQTKAILRKKGIAFQPRSAVQITKEDLQTFDYIVIMDEMNRRNIERQFPKSDRSKVVKLMEFAKVHKDVADPWYTNNYEITFGDVSDGCQGLLAAIRFKYEL